MYKRHSTCAAPSYDAYNFSVEISRPLGIVLESIENTRGTIVAEVLEGGNASKTGKIDKGDIERPDYDSYVSKLENRSRIDEELAEIARQEEAERLRLEQEALARKVAEEKAKLETLKAEEELNTIVETNLETKETRIINVHK